MKLYNIDDRMKGLGYYQIGGGVLGIALTLWLLVQTGTLTGGGLFFILLGFFLFSFSIYSGNLLRKLDNKGLRFSTWNQIFQIFKFNAVYFGFSYTSGIGISIGFNLTEKFHPDASLHFSAFSFALNSEGVDFVSFFINIIPLIIIYWIQKIERDIKTENELKESSKKHLTENNL